MKKYVSILLSFVLILSSVSTLAAEQSIGDILTDTANYIYASVQEPQVGTAGGEWAILGLARSHADVPAEYFETYYTNVQKHVVDQQGVLHDKKYTEYARVILALTAIGKNPMDVSGYNLVAPLEDYDKTVWQGINGAIFALIALDSGNYLPQSTVRDKYVHHILEQQTADGGWTMSGDTADIDTTAMALSALSNYQENEDVKTATDKALDYISDIQLADGGFASWNMENAESCCQVIVALCELGISIHDPRFLKNEKSVADALLTYRLPQSGFQHTKSETTGNQIATEQALYALVALDRMYHNQPTLYDMQNVQVHLTSGKEQIGLPGKSAAVKKLPVMHDGKTFADVVNAEEKAKIEALAARGMINGRTENTFVPTATLTRAEFAAILVKSLGIEFTGENVFSDVKKESWYKDYIRTAYSYGLIKGVSATVFHPEGTVTKEEAATMVQRAAKLCGMAKSYDENSVRDILAGFVDYAKSGDWARESLAFCYDNGILPDSDMEILPKNAVTREEVASMLYNLLLTAKLL
ncbi:MAG: S-layer homology domain-containing protein [Clostridia bacterium]|nr:S-layer homology domain-containing protein [Clostridia bacterium]